MIMEIDVYQNKGLKEEISKVKYMFSISRNYTFPDCGIFEI